LARTRSASSRSVSIWPSCAESSEAVDSSRSCCRMKGGSERRTALLHGVSCSCAVRARVRVRVGVRVRVRVGVRVRVRVPAPARRTHIYIWGCRLGRRGVAGLGGMGLQAWEARGWLQAGGVGLQAGLHGVAQLPRPCSLAPRGEEWATWAIWATSYEL
jgi:hypothetical protein